MLSKKHLNLENRKKIEEGLNETLSFKKIALLVDKDCSTISKEVRKNFTIVEPTSFNGGINNCKNKKDCSYGYKNCGLRCEGYVYDSCERLTKPPYVCNSCPSRKSCKRTKYIYKAREAQEMYEDLLKSSRQGINLTEEEFNMIDSVVSKAIAKGHSPAIIVMNNPNINRSESSIYRDMDKGLYSNVSNCNLPRKVKMKKRNSKDEKIVKDTKNRVNRTYNDYLIYKSSHPSYRIVQFDTVEGRKVGKCLFTIHFPAISYMLAFLIDSQKAEYIVSRMDYIKNIWGEKFKRDFAIGLTDNGKEFQNPNGMENFNGQKIMHLFYCDPGKSYQKAEIENNHTFIRRILPKGTSFDNLNQDDIDLMMNHINSVPREELNGYTPYELACILIGEDIINYFSSPINRNEVILLPALLKKK